MSNAFVMGLFPRVRYVLLSDLLLETMEDRQIEAVFAHELGHVVHRHLWWLLVSALALGSIVAGPVSLALGKLLPADSPVWGPHGIGAVLEPDRAAALIEFIVMVAGFLPMLSWLSRTFERQADVFAARTMQRRQPAGTRVAHVQPGDEETAMLVHGLAHTYATVPADAPAAALATAEVAPSPPSSSPDATSGNSAAEGHARAAASYVGEYGAHVFSSALWRVADINNIPLKARDWLHPSIDKRMRYLREMSADPALTRRFDRFMRRVYTGLLACLCAFGAWAVVQWRWEENAAAKPRNDEIRMTKDETITNVQMTNDRKGVRRTTMLENSHAAA